MMDPDPTSLLHRLGIVTDASMDVPTASGLLLSLDSVCVVGRTTLCDIMCTTTTPLEYQEARLSPKKFSKNLNVCLPYKHSHSLEELFDAKTPLQSIKAAEARTRRNRVLKDERDEFMSKTRHDRSVKEHREQLASVKIQASWRGCRMRPRDPTKRRPPRGPDVLSPPALKDFLTDLAARLNLKPIKGLTLTGKAGKNSKPQVRQSARLEGTRPVLPISNPFPLHHTHNVIQMELRHAAAYVLQRVFLMNMARKAARSRMRLHCLLRAVRQRWILHRFIKQTVTRMRENRRKAKLRREAAIVIQTQMRAFLARRRVRVMKRQRTRHRREEEAATIIQRSFRGRLRLFFFPDFDDFMDQLQVHLLARLEMRRCPCVDSHPGTSTTPWTPRRRQSSRPKSARSCSRPAKNIRQNWTGKRSWSSCIWKICGPAGRPNTPNGCVSKSWTVCGSLNWSGWRAWRRRKRSGGGSWRRRTGATSCAACVRRTSACGA